MEQKNYMEYEHSPYEMASKLLEFNRDFLDEYELLLEELNYLTELFDKLRKSEEFEIIAHYLDRMFMDSVFKNQLEVKE